MNNRLAVFANGLKFENPFILASAPPTSSGVLIRNAFKKGWAGAVIKTIRDEDVINSNVSPRLGALKNKNTVIGLENIEMISDKPIAYWLKEINDIKKEYPDKILIASIMGNGVDSWKKIAKRVSDAGADALELNFSCPNGVTAQGLGLAIGQDIKAIELITECVKQATGIPVIVKLTPNVTDIKATAKAAVNGGADGITAINTVSSLIGVDIDTLNPLPDIKGYSTFGGLSGACVKPIGLRCVAEIAKSVNISIYGAGGISSWKDSVEYIAVGASVLQICTEVMLRGISIIDDLRDGLTDYLDKKQLSSIEEIRGAALNKLKTHFELSRDYRIFARIDPVLCKSCKNCMSICSESGNNAIFSKKEFVQVDELKCIGCSLCNYICPNHAISMIPIN
jgi:dihydropyrimidine dehydrogenase (NAD+) subunit PreA